MFILFATEAEQEEFQVICFYDKSHFTKRTQPDFVDRRFEKIQSLTLQNWKCHERL